MSHPFLIFSQSDYLIQIVDTNAHIGKQCRSRSVGFFRSQLIWIYNVCKGRVYPGSAGQGLIEVFYFCFQDFLKTSVYPVLIISYEMFVRVYEQIQQMTFDLVVCDEGHRLKNTQIKTTSVCIFFYLYILRHSYSWVLHAGLPRVKPVLSNVDKVSCSRTQHLVLKY